MHSTDPSQNFIKRYHHPLDAIFLPKTIAVIGAKDTIGSVGRTIMSNLLSGTFSGKVFPVNPKRATVLGVTSYPSIGAIPEEVDLAIIVTPAPTVPAIIAECTAAKVKAAIIISAGFKELGPEGQRLEDEILAHIKKSPMRIIGPNCLGVMNPLQGLNATFAKGMALRGNIAFISQSGAMCTAVLDWSFEEKIGFSAFVSIGSMVDVNWGDLISYLGEDPHTHSILIYMETIGNPRAFLSAAREVALDKPIIVIKAGRSQEAAKAAASHTGSLAGSDEVFDAALARVGVLRVDSIADLFNMALVLARQPRPKGPNLAIVTNAGGPSVLATDAAVMEGAQLATLQNDTIQEMNTFLPAAWSHANPIDILGDASPERYAKTIEALAKDPGSDGILVVLSPQDMTNPLSTAECLRPFAHLKDKPILASWMGGVTVKGGADLLSQAGIPVFPYPDDAARIFAKMWRYSNELINLYETPQVTDGIAIKRDEAKALLERVRKEGRSLLTEEESKRLLSLYGIPVVETHVAKNPEEAVQIADRIGYPVVIKLLSETITHKSDVGGVKLNLKSAEEVKGAYHEIHTNVSQRFGKEAFQGVTVQEMISSDGYELIIGSSVDEQFGPVILFGTGGVLVEVYKDRALGLPPLNQVLARRLMQHTKIYEALQGVRGRKGSDLPILEQLLVRFSFLIADNSWIKECDINPLRVSSEQIIALDARVLLYPPETQMEAIPQLAIRPYPSKYTVAATLKNGTSVIIRAIQPEDEPALYIFHQELSEKSIRQRYFDFVSLDKRIAHSRLMRICFNDFDRDIALVAEIQEPTNKEKKIIGIVRLARTPGTTLADMTMIIGDAFHNLGLGNWLLRQLIEIARQEGIKTINAAILSENDVMIHLCAKFGFRIESDPIKNLTYSTLKL